MKTANCWFCGSHNTTISQIGKPAEYAVYCDVCEAMGPVRSTPEGATGAHNNIQLNFKQALPNDPAPN